ncbi:lytic polysaccharide monooxygenase [Streptomonospora nanhaiensis]|uniref:Putative carbohydrate-binding protein with CBM5 and CBM33 domain n=1 Tax=Streptomonospora nanhaiensis TaxID=1323731 RepID=A0A853BHB4_9ACTN|nr:lytic polysaccharide monooxygenase [Streptomonospora nanhaiensis]MBV2366363.1 lytic polysaccharide monooxygenase [Streptomonospora nanhaiensis]MBX9387536.1 lytic polysaccharide monooxygenase [Streptomonospora nanhaiensis]NYI94125.1 putative carbohydrate-binding protein with CBM5 and CBM33 domain [Streptomonospora nanhaiensis]
MPTPTRTRRALTALGAVAGLTGALLAAAPVSGALAHGGFTYPATRTYACYVDGIEGGVGGGLNPTNPACADALAEGGDYAFYNWFGNLIGNAAGNHREVVPDGKLCGPTANFDAFTAARTDWPTTELPSGGRVTFLHNAWAHHPGTFTQYVTKDGWNPAEPLGWDDLEPVPFDEVTDPPMRQGGEQGAEYYWEVQLPEKSGYHVIYSIWERSDSPEAFYNCSDVVFTG